MRIGFFGGSFDPPHLAHSLACLWALETGEVDKILLVPVAQHPFGKEHGAAFAHRYEMCRIAVRFLGDRVEVSDIELRRPETSYTVDTIRLLKEEQPDDRFRLMIGTDVLDELADWREPEEVKRLAPPLILPRPREGERFEDAPGALPLISSTRVRVLLAKRAEVSHLVGHSVRSYIEKHQLYRELKEGDKKKMGKKHSPKFLDLVDDALSRVPEISSAEALEGLKANPDAALIDVREEHEYRDGHIRGAEHLSKGVIERDIEEDHPNPEQPLYLYCGGGYRSALAADALQKMGYTNVYSIAGGWRALHEEAVKIDGSYIEAED